MQNKLIWIVFFIQLTSLKIFGIAPVNNLKFFKTNIVNMDRKFTQRKILGGSEYPVGLKNVIFSDERDFEWEGLRTNKDHAKIIAMGYELARLCHYPLPSFKLGKSCDCAENELWFLRQITPKQSLSADDVFTMYLLGMMNMEITMPLVEFNVVEKFLPPKSKGKLDKYINENIYNEYSSDDSDEEQPAFFAMEIIYNDDGDYYFNHYPWENIEGLNVLNVCNSQQVLSEYFIKKINNFDFKKLTIATEFLSFKYFPDEPQIRNLIIENMNTRIDLLKEFAERQQINEKTMWSA